MQLSKSIKRIVAKALKSEVLSKVKGVPPNRIRKEVGLILSREDTAFGGPFG
jgi:hypothetical protein